MQISPLFFSSVIAFITLALVGGYLLLQYTRRRRLARDIEMRLLQIRLPFHELQQEREKQEREQPQPLDEIGRSMQLFSLLARPDIPIVFEVAVHNVGEEIIFYVSVPKSMVEFATKQIQGVWSDAQVDLMVDDYTIFHPQGAVEMATLQLKHHYAFPLRTYREANVDTFGPVLSNFSKLGAVGEGLAMQVIFQRAEGKTRQNIAHFIYQLKKGKKLDDILSGELKHLFFSKTKTEKENEEARLVDEDAVKALESRIAQPLLNVNIRLVASAPTPYRAKELLDGLAGSFSGFTAPLRNDFKIVQLKSSRNELFKFIFREYNSSAALLLNTEELASVFHFPISTTDIPRVKSVKTREAPPPTTMPESGTLLGESLYRGEARPVYIADDDRRRHVYVVGQTGTGKSELSLNMAIGDIREGKGVAVIDPHGDFVDAILGNIPKERYKDVIVFDPSDRMYPLGLNMLEYDPNYPEQKTFIVNEMQGIFNKLFSQETMGPMFEQYMRNALLLLMEDIESEPATLMEVPRIFTDQEYRERKLERIKNPVVLDFWQKEAIKVGGEASLANMTPYITSKFNNFIANDYVRPIIAQTKSAFNFRKIMDEQKILLVNLSKGRIGDINAGLLGMVIVGKLLMAALSRVDIPQEQRKDFNLYIDEFQNFTTDSIATILSEARKYRLDLVIAHQFIAQLEEKIRDAVFGNVGSMIVFRVGAEDAEFLEKQFMPIFTKQDLINIDNFHAYVKLLIAGQATRPFNLRTSKAPIGDTTAKDHLKELSRRVYGVERYIVEEDILKRLRS